MSDSPGSVEQLSTRIDDLELRVFALEHPDERKVITAPQHPAAKEELDSRAEGGDLQTGSVFPVLGRAMLGIAGAYVLRAIAASGAAPASLVTAVAVVYAFAWMVWAMRTSQNLSRFAYAGTSALILAPMLWEVTLHFNVLTPMMTAGVLAGFVTLATVLELRASHVRIVWIGQSAAVLLAVSLGVATHHVLPFLYALVIAVFVTEFGRVSGFSQPAWPLIALATDAAIWGTIFIYSGPPNARGDYVELPAISLILPACLLFAISGGSVMVRVGSQKLRTGVFEAIQLLMAFLLAITSVLLFAPVHGEVAVGVMCLALAAVIYPATFLWLRGFADPRDFRVFGTWAAALVIAGTIWTLPREPAAMALAAAGCAAYLLGARINTRMLELHGAVFLCTAAGISEMPRYVFGTLASSLPGKPVISVFGISIAAALAFAGDRESEESPEARKALQFVPALVAACGMSALLAHGVLALSALAVVPEAQHVAFLRTLTVSSVALSLAFAGSRWGWTAMTRLAYVALAFVAVKLLFEDLRHGHMAFIAGSIFLFAVTLIAVPRLVRRGSRSRAARHPELAATLKS